MAKQKNMNHTCDICGRKTFHKIKSHGYTLCNKHYNQFKKYGKFLDNNPRTIYDRNHFEIKGNIAIIDLYDIKCNKVAETKINLEDLNKVKYYKWRLSNTGYAITSDKNNKTLQLHRLILNTTSYVDHINGDRLDNRKENLRTCTKSQNQMNVNYKGIYHKKNDMWFARIKLNQKTYHLGTYLTKEEALYARYYAETILFKEYRYNKEEPNINKYRKKEIQNYVNEKVQRL